MNDRDQSNSPSDTSAKRDPARDTDQDAPKGDEKSGGEAQADGSTASRPRGQTEDPDKTL